MVRKIVNIFDECVGLAYDIGCSFSSTLQKSLLKDIVSEKKLCMVVNAFHGYAHNQQCQLSFHPPYIVSFGLEDAEICKCTVSFHHSMDLLSLLSMHPNIISIKPSTSMHGSGMKTNIWS